MKPIPYGTQYIDDSDIELVTETLKSDWLTQGPKVNEFENMTAKYHNCKYAVAFSSGTAALHGAYYASGIRTGDEFITSPITFVASSNAGVYMGASPVLADISLETYNVDVLEIEKSMTKKTKVITPVSYAGYPFDLKKLKEISGNCVIIHDAAHAIGAKINGATISDYADMTILSFHPVKHVTAGEGGMVLTNNEEYYKKLMMFRTHGITKNPDEMSVIEGSWYYEMQDLGFNYRLSDLQCALGISQMKKLTESIRKRNKIAEQYERELGNEDWLITPKVRFEPNSDSLHSYHLYPLLVKDENKRLDLFNYLRENSIMVQVHYIPVNYMPYYQKRFGFKRGDFPHAEYFYAREISLPMYPTLTEEQQRYVIDKIKRWA